MKILSNDGKAEKHYGSKPEKILGATMKFGELFFYIKFENKTKPVFVRAKENWCIFGLFIKCEIFPRMIEYLFI